MAVAGDSVFNGMAQNLIDQRLPAVVAMQYSVRADAACEFAEQFLSGAGQQEATFSSTESGDQGNGCGGESVVSSGTLPTWQDKRGDNFLTWKPAR
jgi:hypothetical protein